MDRMFLIRFKFMARDLIQKRIKKKLPFALRGVLTRTGFAGTATALISNTMAENTQMPTSFRTNFMIANTKDIVINDYICHRSLE